MPVFWRSGRNDIGGEHRRHRLRGTTRDHATLPRLAFGVAAALLAFSGNAGAGDGPSGCADLSGFPAAAGVDFARDVRPILEGCTGCHGDNGAAGLDLRVGQAYANLVGVTATTNPDRVRVVPGRPDDSLLLSAINCAVTGGPSFQMPGTEPAERALIRDWIAAGAAMQSARAIPVAHPAGLILLAVIVIGTVWARSRRSRR